MLRDRSETIAAAAIVRTVRLESLRSRGCGDRSERPLWGG